ncbi:MAG: rod shape-determining protein RodA [Actinobacteria bacterium]|nr:rod shape-determining protein RodA [Actinomycetota bacterium]
MVLILILTIGFLMVKSATNTINGGLETSKQIRWILIGIPILILFSLVDYHRLKNYSVFLYLVNLGFLISVYIFGQSALGAQRRIPLGSFVFQPSEFAKIILIITLAAFLSERKGKITKISDVLLAGLHIAVPWILIFHQPDLGTAMVLIAILFGMLLVAGTESKYLIGLIFIGIIGIVLIFNFNVLKDYQMKRLLVFVNPDMDPLGAGYNLLQSKIAIGSGRFWGKGLFSGTQSRLNFIPEHHTDFIFSVLGEELGFAGAFSLVVLYFVLITRGLRIGSLSKDIFGTLIAAGIVSMLLFQIFVNIGMTVGLMPITGIPLPFVSYGGSSMFANMMGIGLLLNVYMRRFK